MQQNAGKFQNQTRMSTKQKRYFLTEEEIPTQWYNIQADMVNKPLPPLNPATKQPLKPEDLFPIFAEELARQELDQTHAWIDIPEEVRDMYPDRVNLLQIDEDETADIRFYDSGNLNLLVTRTDISKGLMKHPVAYMHSL